MGTILSYKFRLRRPKDFKRTYTGKSFAGSYMVLYCRENGLDRLRFGFSVSKKFGKAVARNRAKRLLREVCQLNQESLKGGYDIIFIARQRLKGVKYDELEKQAWRLWDKAKLRRKK